MKTHFPPGAAVLLLNSGGPGNPDEVEPFLRRLFADPHMIQLPAGRFYQTALARWMAAIRSSAMLHPCSPKPGT
jgi:protoheme ferro-lyase